MRHSLAFFTVAAALIAPDAARATSCAAPWVVRETLALAVESVTVDGVAVADVAPWRRSAHTLLAWENGRVHVTGDGPTTEEFVRVP